MSTVERKPAIYLKPIRVASSSLVHQLENLDRAVANHKFEDAESCGKKILRLANDLRVLSRLARDAEK